MKNLMRDNMPQNFWFDDRATSQCVTLLDNIDAFRMANDDLDKLRDLFLPMAGTDVDLSDIRKIVAQNDFNSKISMTGLYDCLVVFSLDVDIPADGWVVYADDIIDNMTMYVGMRVNSITK